MSERVRPAVAFVFALATFTSAFLLFQIQPLLAKSILPWFGGTPAVWTTCMLVFQVLLFAGYLYAHLTTAWLTLRWQILLHVGLLAAALTLLPIVPGDAWKPAADDSPVFRIIGLLLATVGLPYFLLSATGPLLQDWYRRATGGAAPYRLYALSNIGSLLALISYPFVVEPAWSTWTQSIVWSAGFAGFATLCGLSGWLGGRQTPSLQSQEPGDRQAAGHRGPLSLSTVAMWFSLAGVPSLMLLAITNQVCLDVAVIPFLWIVPLTLYLITFILCFDSDAWYQRRIYVMAMAVTLGCVCVLMMRGAGGSMAAQAIVYFAGLFFAGMVCHGELVRLRPDPRHLTTFYLTISAGGAAGGLFAGLVAPWLFRGYFELHTAIVAAGLVCLGLFLREDDALRRRTPRWLPAATGCGVLLAAVLGFSRLGGTTEYTLAVTRNFYGVLRVKDEPADGRWPARRTLSHGRIIHGLQLTGADADQPTSYYGRNSGIGLVLRGTAGQLPRTIGMVGLGTGTLAAYGRPDDQFRFYEINRDVIRLANESFTFLKESRADVTIAAGDARLVLERESPQQYDVLALDAFSGDAIPVHLLTREAMTVYRRHLKPDGILAIHISNLHFDLRPVIAGLADAEGYESRTVLSADDFPHGVQACLWALLCRDGGQLDRLLGETTTLPPPDQKILWTDGFSNLFKVLR